MGISKSILIHLATKLPLSRMQRDLTDSTTLRNQGVAMGHSYLALKNILNGLDRITINNFQMKNELDGNWEVLAEAIQTVLRKTGNEDSYEKLKILTRGQKIDRLKVQSFINDLKISDEDKRMLLSLTPSSYIGIANKLVDQI